MTSLDTAVARLADQGRVRLSGSTLFGQKVDPENLQHVLAVLAVEGALHDHARHTQKMLDTLKSMQPRRSLMSRIFGDQDGRKVRPGSFEAEATKTFDEFRSLHSSSHGDFGSG